MGLFDFALHPGEKFTKDEIKILDQNFNSISAYTKKKYKFSSKEVKSDLYGEVDMRINYHRITYIHEDVNTDEWDSEWLLYINCDRYYLRNKDDFSGFKRLFDDPFDDEAARIKIPEINEFPAPVLIVGYRGNGFAVELEYNFKDKINRVFENSDLTKKCVDKIKSNTIKYLKAL